MGDPRRGIPPIGPYKIEDILDRLAATPETRSDPTPIRTQAKARALSWRQAAGPAGSSFAGSPKNPGRTVALALVPQDGTPSRLARRRGIPPTSG